MFGPYTDPRRGWPTRHRLNLRPKLISGLSLGQLLRSEPSPTHVLAGGSLSKQLQLIREGQWRQQQMYQETKRLSLLKKYIQIGEGRALSNASLVAIYLSHEAQDQAWQVMGMRT